MVVQFKKLELYWPIHKYIYFLLVGGPGNVILRSLFMDVRPLALFLTIMGLEKYHKNLKVER